MKHTSKILAICLSLVLAAGAASPVAAEEEESEVDSVVMAQYEAWAQTVETNALTLSDDFLQTQAASTAEYVDTTVTIGDLVASRSAEAAEEANSRYVKCTARVDNPHYSKGAGGAIYKSRYKCESKGVSTTVKLRVRGLLSLYPASKNGGKAGKAQSRAKSDANITVKANTGFSNPYYTPKTGYNGGRGTGYWNATSTLIINSHPSLSGKRTGSNSKTVWKKI